MHRGERGDHVEAHAEEGARTLGGAGGDGSDGADVYMLCSGTYTDNSVDVNTSGGSGGLGGSKGLSYGTDPDANNGTNGNDGRRGKSIVGQLVS